mmetsp:Transcript_63363/g.196285  ORF Transcript_63363/g.196285 Transcript_63363/m.196285 type:complete len:254 (-) Transcript_63363:1005-1766(-)
MQNVDALPGHLLLVEAVLQEDLVHHQRGQHGEHQGRDEVPIVPALRDEEDHGHGHALEAAEHGRAAHHGVDPRLCHVLSGVPFHHQDAHGASNEASDEHRAGEVAGGHGDPCERDVDEGVRDERQGQIPEAEVLAAGGRGLARDEQLHRGLRGGDEQRGHRIVLVLASAGEAHKLEVLAVSVVVVAARQLRRHGGHQRAHGREEEALHDPAQHRPPEPPHRPLPEAADGQAEVRVEGAERAEGQGQGDEDGHV